MQVDDRANDHNMHYLVAVAPVVKPARDEAFGNLGDVHQPSQNSQGVHNDKEAQGVRAAHPVAKYPKQKEAEAEEGLPHKSPQAPDVGSGCGGGVDAVSRQENVGQ